jgi:hypothetical protein
VFPFMPVAWKRQHLGMMPGVVPAQQQRYCLGLPVIRIFALVRKE